MIFTYIRMRAPRVARSIVALFVAAALSGCATTGSGTGTKRDSKGTSVGTAVDDRGRVDGKYMDSGAQSNLNTIGIESSDLISACSEMVGKMLANPQLGGQQKPPHIIIDAKYFRLQSASRLNVNMLADALRAELLNAANGRLIFIARQDALVVEEEKELTQAGIIDTGTTPTSSRQLGADYRLTGNITDLTQGDSARLERFTQFNFEVVDTKTGQLIFSDVYKFKKAGTINVVDR